MNGIKWAAGLAIGLGIITSAIAATCPTQLTQDAEGYWKSDQTPGWRSHKPTPKNVTISPNDFGGVVYSPSKKRLACVYKGTDGKWVALVSNVSSKVKIDKHAPADVGGGSAWKYNKRHNDYACGKPTVTSIASCPFELQ